MPRKAQSRTNNMEELNFTVNEEASGGRIDKYVTEQLGEDYSRMLVKHLIEQGYILVNGSKVKPNYSIRPADEIFVEIPPPEASFLEPEDIPIDIIHEDEWILVVNKSPGMVVHPGAGNKTGTLAAALLFHCGNLPDAGDDMRPGIVHRLDKDTSGVIVVAKTDKAMRSLSKQFQDRTVKKQYAALVKGRIEIDNGVIEEPLARHPVDRKKMAIDHTYGKHSKTTYHVIKRFERFTFIRLDLDTGRTHQIRVHMKHLGHPVLGDLTYGGPAVIKRQALHAEKIELTHPASSDRVVFEAPIPEDMQKLIDEGEWDASKAQDARHK